jgi:hypothetical protein
VRKMPFFAENCLKSQKIMIMALTQGSFRPQNTFDLIKKLLKNQHTVQDDCM